MTHKQDEGRSHVSIHLVPHPIHGKSPCLGQDALKHDNEAPGGDTSSAVRPQSATHLCLCEALEPLSAVKFEFVIVTVLLPVAMQKLLDTNPPASQLAAPVPCCLLISVLVSFLFFLLFITGRDCHVIRWVTHMCFGLVAFAMVLAIAFQGFHAHA